MRRLLLTTILTIIGAKLLTDLYTSYTTGSRVLNTTFSSEDDVIIATDTNFEAILETFDFVLVDFYAPWCTHCRKLAPEYAKVAQIMKEKHGDVVIAKVNLEENKKLHARFKIKSLPTIMYFEKLEQRKVTTYSGPRKSEDMVRWVEGHLFRANAFYL